MQLSGAPTQLQLPWGNGDSSKTNPIPVPSQIGISPGRASWTDGFVPLNATPVTSGGIPPFKSDMNGGLFEMSAVDVWTSAGAGFPWNSAYSTAIGGYPKGARVLRATGFGYWLSIADNNTTDPDTGGAGWIPDRAVSSVYASGTQTVNAGTNKVLFNTVEFDSLSQWNAGSQRFVANWPGLYRVCGSIQMPSAPAQNIALFIFKNGAASRLCIELPQVSSVDLSFPFSSIIAMNATDYVELFLELGSNTGLAAGAENVYAQFEYLGNG